MERLSKYRTLVYIGVVILTSLIYTFILGRFQELSVRSIFADAAACLLSAGPVGIFLQRMQGYGMPWYVQCILFIGAVIGFEAIAFYFLTPSFYYDHFVSGLWVRVLIVCLFSAVFMIWKQTVLLKEALNKSSVKEPVRILPAPETASSSIDRISVRTGTGIKVIPSDELLYIQADGDYISFYTMEGHWMKEQTMKSIQEQLSPLQFIRIHRSFIVNISSISRIERYGQQQLILLKNGHQVRISAPGYRLLKDALQI